MSINKAKPFGVITSLLVTAFLITQPITIAAPPPARITVINVWLNAFIPNDIPNLTRTLPGNGAFSGKTAIPGPTTSCFLDDQRTFSATIGQAQRAQSVAIVDMTVPKLTSQVHRVSPTVEADCDTGKQICMETGSEGSMSVQEIKMVTSEDGARAATLRFVGSANNPCFKHTPDFLVPDIDWDITVDISILADGESGVAKATGKVDGFPAFEMYIAVNDGPGRPLFKLPPPPGNTPLDLKGPARFDIPQLSIVTLDAGITGKWESTDADKRFLFEITGNTVQWTERGTVNTTPGISFPRSVTLGSSSGKFRVERANDNAALTFLGFQPQSLRDAILNRSPQPSFIVFRRTGGTLSAEWNGLVVTKNADGTLKDVLQPGVRPPKAFVFKRIS